MKLSCLSLCALLCVLMGCQSPYYADRGAGIGLLAGAGTGAIVGNALGDTGAGLAIGAGLGTLTGAVVGSSMDEMQAQNRAEIAAQLGRQVNVGVATTDEVIAMSRAGVDSRLIQNYVRTSGVSQPLAAQDVIYLHQQGVATEVIQTMQNPPVPQQAIAARPTTVIEEHYYGAPSYCGPRIGYHHRPHHSYHRGHHRGPRVSWGVSVTK